MTNPDLYRFYGCGYAQQKKGSEQSDPLSISSSSSTKPTHRSAELGRSPNRIMLLQTSHLQLLLPQRSDPVDRGLRGRQCLDDALGV